MIAGGRVHQVAPGQRNRRGEPRPLRAHRLFGNLDNYFLAALELLLDGQAAAMRSALLPAPRTGLLLGRGDIKVISDIVGLRGVIEDLSGRGRRLVGFDVLLAEHLGDRAESVGLALKIRDMQEARFFKPDIDKRCLHPGQHAGDLSLVDIAHQSAVGVAFEIELSERTILEKRDPHFECGCVDYDFTFHLEILVRSLAAVFQTHARLGRMLAELWRWNGLARP